MNFQINWSNSFAWLNLIQTHRHHLIVIIADVISCELRNNVCRICLNHEVNLYLYFCIAENLGTYVTLPLVTDVSVVSGSLKLVTQRSILKLLSPSYFHLLWSRSMFWCYGLFSFRMSTIFLTDSSKSNVWWKPKKLLITQQNLFSNCHDLFKFKTQLFGEHFPENGLTLLAEFSK